MVVNNPNRTAKNGNHILTHSELYGGGTRYYLDAKGFCVFPNSTYPRNRNKYSIAFLNMDKLSTSERVQAFLELADQHLFEGKKIESLADKYYYEWEGFTPSKQLTYVSQREADIAGMATAAINLTPVVLNCQGMRQTIIQPKPRLQSIEDSQRDLVATYSYALCRYHDVVGCYLAIPPRLRPASMKNDLDAVLAAVNRIGDKVPRDIVHICEPHVPSAPKLSSWIRNKARVASSRWNW